MKTQSRNAIVFAAAGLVIAGGLAVVTQHKKAPELTGRALDAVPSGALLVATADLGALRASPVGAPFLREGREIPGLGKVRDVCGFDPMDTLTEAAIAIPASGDSGEFGLVASGPINDDALITCASKVIEARGGRPVVTNMGSFRSVRDTSLATAGGEIAVKKGGPLLLGAGTYLRTMIDTADGRAPSIRSSRAHTALAGEIGSAALRVTVVLSAEQRRALAEEVESAGAPGSPARAVTGGALGLTLGPSVAVHGIVSCDDASACARLAETLQKAREARAGDPLARILGLATVLEKLSIKPEGELIQARVDVPADQATMLAERLLALRSLRRSAPEEPTATREPKKPHADEVIGPDAGAKPAHSATATPSASAPQSADKPKPKR
ncbi:Sulfate adenylyltransferase [Minicystis rosea]|nr:Sulfate adenylyltransferase [Minicystis rosea]